MEKHEKSIKELYGMPLKPFLLTDDFTSKKEEIRSRYKTSTYALSIRKEMMEENYDDIGT